MKQIVFGVATLVVALAATAQAQSQRDPFARPALPAAAAAADIVTEAEQPRPALHLRAVLVTPGRSLANINGQILAVGERLGDYQLTKVDERAVTLSRYGVTSVLVLDEASRK